MHSSTPPHSAPSDSSSIIKISTTWGDINIVMADGKVASCHLPLLATQPAPPFAIKNNRTDMASTFITAALTGKTFHMPNLGSAEGTNFQKQVWQAIAKIPIGKTTTYGQLAKAIGRPKAYRAVANACGKNPLPIFIPCHRVIAANGKIGGFSAGLPWKNLLLTAEQNKTPSGGHINGVIVSHI